MCRWISEQLRAAYFKATLIGGLFHCNAKHFLVKNAAEQKMALLMNGLVVKGKS